MKDGLRVLTANLLDDRADPDALQRTIDEQDIDVLCVQELGARCAAAIREVLPGGGLAPDSIRRGLGIATRRDAGFDRFPLPYRDGCVVRLLPEHWSELDRAIEIACVHISGPHTWPYFPARHTRKGQLRGLLEFLDRDADTPRAVLGDFNASPAWPFYRQMAARMTDAAVQSAEPGRRLSPTWPHLPGRGLRGLLRIDHCFVDGLRAARSRVLPIEGSDHLGLCLELETEDSA